MSLTPEEVEEIVQRTVQSAFAAHELREIAALRAQL